MNAAARSLAMTSTSYTDPSGLDPSTTSTAADQVRLGMAAMQVPALAAITAESTAVVPVAGVIRNTNALLGQDGIVGLKTGSTQAAGGCLLVAAWQQVDGHNVLIVAATSASPDRPGPSCRTHCKPASTSCLPWIPPSTPARDNSEGPHRGPIARLSEPAAAVLWRAAIVRYPRCQGSQTRARASRSGSRPMTPRLSALEWKSLRLKAAPALALASSLAWSQIRSPSL